MNPRQRNFKKDLVKEFENASLSYDQNPELVNACQELWRNTSENAKIIFEKLHYVSFEEIEKLIENVPQKEIIEEPPEPYIPLVPLYPEQPEPVAKKAGRPKGK